MGQAAPSNAGITQQSNGLNPSCSALNPVLLMFLRRQWKVAQMTGTLQPMGETQMELQVPGFNLTQP